MKPQPKFRAVMPDNRVKALGFKLFYQNDQYLGSFLRRANQFAFESSGHDSYGVPELEMFTGLKDKNGKEIYKGDILEQRTEINGIKLSSRQQVIWVDDSACFGLIPSNPFNFTNLTKERGETLEVIGNVSENPKFLKKKV